MDAISESLPPVDEVQKVFKDFRQVLRAGALLTPLQRANRIAARNSSIAYGQKRESDASRVHNLLQPGHFTRLKVGFLQLLAASDLSISLKIPVTLVRISAHLVLLRNNDAGTVVSRVFDDEECALQAFFEEVSKTVRSRANSPRFVHKHSDFSAHFYFDGEAAAQAWKAYKDDTQVLQQFVQPHSKKALLLRVHWKDNQRSPTFYFISSHPYQTQTLPSILTKVCDFSRSLSETDFGDSQSGVRSSTSTLIVQRSKELPRLTKALEACLRVIASSLGAGEKVSEMVCDFTSDQQHQWVFLSCRGFTFACKKRLLTQTFEQKRVIDLKYLMYPVVARRSILQKRLRWNAKLRMIAATQKLPMAVFMSTLHDYTELPIEQMEDQTTPSPTKTATPVTRPKTAAPLPECEILNRQVLCYEQLKLKSKLHREDAKACMNFVEKHGGRDAWRPLLRELLSHFQEQQGVARLFTEKMGLEETESFVNSLLRVISGDCNLYFKEALKRVHHRSEISHHLYQTFIQELEAVILSVLHDKVDIGAILQRFEQLEPYIASSV